MLLFDIAHRFKTLTTKRYADGELEEKSNVQKMHFSHSDKPIKFYNLDVITSVGYRVNSYQATQFRIWATGTLGNGKRQTEGTGSMAIHRICRNWQRKQS